MNIYAELQRIWKSNATARKLCPPEKLFTGMAPDKFVDADGAEVPLDAPYCSIRFIDGMTPGGTSSAIDQIHVVQFSAYAATRADAEAIRNHARDLFEDCNIKLGGTTETFQDCSLDVHGELPAVDGIHECFQRFQIETTFNRPRRKRV